MSARRLAACGLAAAAVLFGAHAAGAATAGASAISGTAWTDTNWNGVVDPGESPRQGDVIYLEDSSGQLLSSVATDAAGRYSFTGLADGDYRVEYDGGTWSSLQADWTPTTTGSIYPNETVHLQGTARADFGWRQIARSTSPMTSYVGSDGLTVESYDDVITARSLYDALAAGTLIGPEAPRTVVRFDSGPTSVTNISVNGTQGSYYGYRATSLVSWASWVSSTDVTLFHEYSHAASLYDAYIVQQDSTLSAYLKARGILGDPRLDSSHSWNRAEILAEDFRQRFATAHAASAPQDNTDIPRMSDVAGLADYLAGPFRGTTATSPSPSPSPSSSPVASTSPSPSPSPTASASPTPTISGKGGGKTKH